MNLLIVDGLCFAAVLHCISVLQWGCKQKLLLFTKFGPVPNWARVQVFFNRVVLSCWSCSSRSVRVLFIKFKNTRPDQVQLFLWQQLLQLFDIWHSVSRSIVSSRQTKGLKFHVTNGNAYFTLVYAIRGFWENWGKQKRTVLRWTLGNCHMISPCAFTRPRHVTPQNTYTSATFPSL